MSPGTRVGRVARGAIVLVELYRTLVSPMRPACCRFSPTCSQYTVDALREFGLARGCWLSSVRLVKCGPWHRGGWDPIPERRETGCLPGADSGKVVDGAALRSDSFV